MWYRKANKPINLYGIPERMMEAFDSVKTEYENALNITSSENTEQILNNINQNLVQIFSDIINSTKNKNNELLFIEPLTITIGRNAGDKGMAGYDSNNNSIQIPLIFHQKRYPLIKTKEGSYESKQGSFWVGDLPIGLISHEITHALYDKYNYQSMPNLSDKLNKYRQNKMEQDFQNYDWSRDKASYFNNKSEIYAFLPNIIEELDEINQKSPIKKQLENGKNIINIFQQSPSFYGVYKYIDSENKNNFLSTVYYMANKNNLL